MINHIFDDLFFIYLFIFIQISTFIWCAVTDVQKILQLCCSFHPSWNVLLLWKWVSWWSYTHFSSLLFIAFYTFTHWVFFFFSKLWVDRLVLKGFTIFNMAQFLNFNWFLPCLCVTFSAVFIDCFPPCSCAVIFTLSRVLLYGFLCLEG